MTGQRSGKAVTGSNISVGHDKRAVATDVGLDIVRCILLLALAEWRVAAMVAGLESTTTF